MNIKSELQRIKCSYKTALRDQVFRRAFFTSILILAAALIVNFFAGIYALERASNSVTDIILDNIRVYDVDIAFVYGPLLMFVLLALFLIAEPRRIPFTLESIGLFVLIRSGFVTLTHLGPVSDRAVIASDFISYFTSGSDLFFSGHTGLPFLLALVFWDNRLLRHSFVALSVIFGAVVLMGHFHYSIDVLSAFFISYTIYHLATVFFPKTKRVFDSARVLPEMI
jgi:hypothetical protein